VVIESEPLSKVNCYITNIYLTTLITSTGTAKRHRLSDFTTEKATPIINLLEKFESVEMVTAKLARVIAKPRFNLTSSHVDHQNRFLVCRILRRKHRLSSNNVDIKMVGMVFSIVKAEEARQLGGRLTC
jgi:hypothetical protein